MRFNSSFWSSRSWCVRRLHVVHRVCYYDTHSLSLSLLPIDALQARQLAATHGPFKQHKIFPRYSY